jgi:hypothetical protein
LSFFLVSSKSYKIGEFQKIPPGTHLERSGTKIGAAVA